MIRTLALDIGEKRIGIAVSDPLGYTAQGLETYVRKGDVGRDVEHILAIAESYAPVCLLFGMPRNMDGSYGYQSRMVQEFADAVLIRWTGEIAFFDERLTTVSAERVLIDADMSREKRRKVVDKVAAVVILQAYLDTERNKRERRQKENSIDG
ncbi:Holliday junction resolvase RuvX [Christensenellaceae bacterium OttesenSCG-928-M15]|nr:Holliday junction resolvase RuvX [Christensenellaceae bacterium OttesenSCG-928-M15]